MPVLHSKSFWNDPQRDKSKPLIQMSCVDIAFHHRIELQNPKAQFPAHSETVKNQFFADVRTALEKLREIGALEE